MAEHAHTIPPATLARRRHRRAAPGALDRRPLPVADAELIDLCGQYIAWSRADRAQWDAMTEEEHRADLRTKPAPWTEAARQTPDKVLAHRIAALPATTPAGLRSKAEALRWYYGGTDEEDPFDWRCEDRLIGSVLRDILGRAGT